MQPLDRANPLSRDVLALAIYECSLTFAEEVEYFWGAPRTGAAVVYYLNKYILIFMYIAGAVGLALPGASAQVRAEISDSRRQLILILHLAVSVP